MPLLVLLRHLPTVDDTNNIYSSRHAKPRFAEFQEGYVESLRHEISQFFRQHELRKIYCSANTRGVETARMIVAGFGDDYQITSDERLDNIVHPEWDGLHHEVVQATTQYRVWHSRPHEAVFLNGETLFDVAKRVDSFLDDMDSAGGLIVSHTVPMQVILCRRLGVDLSRIWAFKFDHWRMSIVLDDILLRYNSNTINDIAFSELRR